MKKRLGEFGIVLVSFASTQIISQVLRMLSGFLVVMLISPEVYGRFSGVGIFLGYILIGHGGIINGLSRELPYELGRGNDEYAKQMASSVFTISLVLSIIASLVFVFFCIYFFFKGDYKTAIIYFSYFFMAGFHLLNKQFLPVLYRTSNDFKRLSRQNIILGLGNLITVSLVWFWGFWGLCVRGVLLYLLEFALLFINKPYDLDLKVEKIHIRSLFKTGFPIFLVGYVNPLWSTILNNIIFTIGGPLHYGLFALSSIVENAFGTIPKAISQVLYPRMTIMLGQGHTVNQIISKNIKPIIFQFFALLIAAIIGAIILPFIIPVILPKYVDGISAAQWMIFVPVVLSFGALNNLYNVVKKQQWYFFSLVFGALIGSLYVFIQYKINGFYIEVFPQGLIIGKLTQQILGFLFLFKIR